MTIPNLISVGRIILAPIFALFLLRAESPKDFFVVGVLIAISGISDVVDGFIARRYNMTSKLGKILDPAADKITVLAVTGCLWIRYPELWVFFALFIGKEVIMAAAALFIIHRNKDIVGAKWFGKLYTVVFYVTMICAVVDSRADSRARLAMMIFMAFFTLLSFIMYIPVFFSQMYVNENKSSDMEKVK